MNWIKTAVIMGAVTLVLLVTGVRKLDREEEGKRDVKEMSRGSDQAKGLNS